MALLFDRSPPVYRHQVSVDAEKQPITKRFKALSIQCVDGATSRDALIRAMRDSSTLLAYNAAYELGRIQDIDSIPALEEVLTDFSLHPIVRHKAAEALGAFFSESIVPILKSSLAADPVQEVRDTCELALSQIQRVKESYFELDLRPSVEKSREVLLNEDNSISERYTALFHLRKQASLCNDAAEKAFSSILKALRARNTLLRHGVVYVLSQIRNKCPTYFLSNILRNIREHPLVRLEAAKALGYIVDNYCITLLEEFAHDPEPIVSQSCEVALKKLNEKPLEMYHRTDCPRVEFVNQTFPDEEKSLCNLLLDKKQLIWKRFRALGVGKLDSPAYRNALTEAMWDGSSLLAYSAASELVTMQDVDTIPALKAVLCDRSLHPIVRHKAAEALGAFGLESNAPALKSSLGSDPAPEVRETCEVALRRIEEFKNVPPMRRRSSLSSFPVLPALCVSVPILREVLFGEVSTVYERVGAVFNLGKAWTYQKKEEALLAIIEARGAKSALLRYWVVRILSNARKEKAVEALSESLRDPNEHPLVRQEAAESLGWLAGLGFLADACVFLLEEFSSDPEPIVAQRCEVALMRLEFGKSRERFELVRQWPVMTKRKRDLISC